MKYYDHTNEENDKEKGKHAMCAFLFIRKGGFE